MVCQLNITLVIDVIAGPLTYLFFLSFSPGVFHTGLKIAHIVPVFKGGVPTKLVDYKTQDNN
jgi:hypothetical protein